jgi:hypothetical protein
VNDNAVTCYDTLNLNTTEFRYFVSPKIFLRNVVYCNGLLFYNAHVFKIPDVQFSCTFSTLLY